mmetsp:Transcript_11599/g.17319  ORF Transcript_11599/g.17319 Transcript_11599/m.17319 type:complete len:87 (+) Transcript_11599:3691-3951(+)
MQKPIRENGIILMTLLVKRFRPEQSYRVNVVIFFSMKELEAAEDLTLDLQKDNELSEKLNIIMIKLIYISCSRLTYLCITHHILVS